MGVMNPDLLRKLCAESSGIGTKTTISELGRKLNIDRKTVRKYVDIIKGSGLIPQQISELNDEELEVFFQIKAHRKDFIQPDFKEIYAFLHPKRTLKDNAPSIEQAWLQLYVKPQFNIPQDKLTAHYVKLDNLPEQCMSLNTFRRAYNSYVESLNKQFDYLSSTATIDECSSGALLEIDGMGGFLEWKGPNGVVNKSRVFVSVLKYSGMIFAYAQPRATSLNWSRFIIASFNYFGGTPAYIKSDNDVAITIREKVVGTNGKAQNICRPNADMRYICDYYHVDFVLSGVRAPRHKASCERSVRIVEDLIQDTKAFKHTHYHNLDEVNLVLRKLVDDYNNQSRKSTGNNIEGFSHRAFFEMYEQGALGKLPDKELEIVDSSRHTVSQRGYICYLSNNYFIGKNYIGRRVYCIRKDDSIEIFTFDTLKLITTHKVDLKNRIKSINIKNRSQYTEAELALSRTLEDYGNLTFNYPGLTYELNNLFIHIFKNIVLNTADRSRSCNWILKHCKEHSLNTEELKLAIKYVLKNEIASIDRIKQLLMDAVTGRSKVVQFTNRKELQRDIIEKCADEKALDSNVRDSDYFSNRIAKIYGRNK